MIKALIYIIRLSKWQDIVYCAMSCNVHDYLKHLFHINIFSLFLLGILVFRSFGLSLLDKCRSQLNIDCAGFRMAEIWGEVPLSCPDNYSLHQSLSSEGLSFQQRRSTTQVLKKINILKDDTSSHTFDPDHLELDDFLLQNIFIQEASLVFFRSIVPAQSWMVIIYQTWKWSQAAFRLGPGCQWAATRRWGPLSLSLSLL